MARPRSTSLPYVPIDPHIDEHAKTEALVDALSGRSSIPDRYLVEVPQKLIKLAGRKAIDGVLGHLSDNALARACAWDGDAAELREALVSTGWLDIDGDGAYQIHDWCDYGGMVLAKREENRARKAAQRTRNPAKKQRKRQGRVVTRNSAGCHADFRGLSHGLSRGQQDDASTNAGDNAYSDAKNGEKIQCVSTEKQNDGNELDKQGELSRGIPRDVTRFSALEGEGEYTKQPGARARLVARKSGNAAAGLSDDSDLQWLVDNASDGMPIPIDGDMAALSQVGRIGLVEWRECTAYALAHADRSPWRYAAARAVARYATSSPHRKPLRIDSEPPIELAKKEIMNAGSIHGMTMLSGDDQDALLQIHGDEPIGECLAEFCAENSTRKWSAFIKWARDRRRSAAEVAMARLAQHGFAVPVIGEENGRSDSNIGS